MAAETVTIDRQRSVERIELDVEALAGGDYTTSDQAIRRYAYTRAYRNTLDYFVRALEELGFVVEEDPVGTLVARNRPKGERVFGIGSHCDSNRRDARGTGRLAPCTTARPADRPRAQRATIGATAAGGDALQPLRTRFKTKPCAAEPR